MKHASIFAILLLLLVGLIPLRAQTGSNAPTVYSGVIVDVNGEPIPGVAVFTSSGGEISDIDGNYKITATPSFNGFGNSRATVIDYIYYNGFKAAESFRVLDAPFEGKPYISDHYPIVACLEY